jgi:hypothetical protein
VAHRRATRKKGPPTKRVRLIFWVSIPAAAVLAVLVATWPSTAMAQVKRTAVVKVENKTGKELLSVMVAHKYSNVYKNAKAWNNLLPGRTSTDALTVEYETGELTVGRDWWMVVWVYKGDPTLHVTDPQNLRDIVDAVEKFTQRVLPFVSAGVGRVAGGDVGSVAGLAVGATTAERLLNSEPTMGFKQHILRAEDSRENDSGPTLIQIGRNEVTFRSRSGESVTGIVEISANAESQFKRPSGQTPRHYPPEKLRDHYCYKNSELAYTDDACLSTVDAYALAAKEMQKGVACWKIIRYAVNKGARFTKAIEEWVQYYYPDAGCTIPSTPERCRDFLALYCSSDFTHGLQVRPSVGLGGLVGSGYGFGDDGMPNFQLSAGVGLRYFFLADMVDAHAALGIVSVPREAKTRQALMYLAGVGLVNGLIDVAFIAIDDPTTDSPFGMGLSLSIDVVAIKNFQTQASR